MTLVWSTSARLSTSISTIRATGRRLWYCRHRPRVLSIPASAEADRSRDRADAPGLPSPPVCIMHGPTRLLDRPFDRGDRRDAAEAEAGGADAIPRDRVSETLRQRIERREPLRSDHIRPAERSNGGDAWPGDACRGEPARGRPDVPKVRRARVEGRGDVERPASRYRHVDGRRPSQWGWADASRHRALARGVYPRGRFPDDPADLLGHWARDRPEIARLAAASIPSRGPAPGQGSAGRRPRTRTVRSPCLRPLLRILF
jgi:hypothetical protein